MKVKVVSYADIQQVLGARELEITVANGATIEDLFNELVLRFGKPLERLIRDPRTGNLWPFLILLNDADVRSEGLKQRLKNGDVITILLPAEGG